MTEPFNLLLRKSIEENEPRLALTYPQFYEKNIVVKWIKIYKSLKDETKKINAIKFLNKICEYYYINNIGNMIKLRNEIGEIKLSEKKNFKIFQNNCNKLSIINTGQNFTTTPAKDIAKFLTIISAQSISSLKYQDIVSKKYNKNKEISNLFNKISSFVKDKILRNENKKDIYLTYIRVAYYCYKYGNYFALNAILAGLNSNCIERLNLTTSNTVLKKLNKILDKNNNYKIYRNQLKSRIKNKKKVIPDFAVIFCDLEHYRQIILNTELVESMYNYIITLTKIDMSYNYDFNINLSSVFSKYKYQSNRIFRQLSLRIKPLKNKYEVEGKKILNILIKLNIPLSKWTQEHINEWLKFNKYRKYIPNFKKNKISNGEILMFLKETYLYYIIPEKLGICKKIYRLIQNLKKNPKQPMSYYIYNKDIKKWDHKDFVFHLYCTGCQKYISNFSMEEIDNEEILTLTDELLQAYGVDELGLRKRILRVLK